MGCQQVAGTPHKPGKGYIMAGRKDVNQIIKELRRRGCTAEYRNSGHWRISRPGYQSITMSQSPRSGSTDLVKRDVRKYLGIEL